MIGILIASLLVSCSSSGQPGDDILLEGLDFNVSDMESWLDAWAEGEERPLKRLRTDTAVTDELMASAPERIRFLPSPVHGVVLPPQAAAEYVMFLARQGRRGADILTHLTELGISHETVIDYVNGMEGFHQIGADYFDYIIASIPRDRSYSTLLDVVTALREINRWVNPLWGVHLSFALCACLNRESMTNTICTQSEWINLRDGSVLRVYLIPQARFSVIMNAAPDHMLMTPFKTAPL